MQINITYAASVANAPAGFKTAVQAAVQFYEDTFDADITLNITFGWGEVGGNPLDSGAVGESLTTYILTDYVTSARTLQRNATSPAITDAFRRLAISQESPPLLIELPYAQARVLGQAPAVDGVPDGYVGLSATAPFTFDPNNRAVAGEYDAIGALEHEISEVLGRQAFDGAPPAGGGDPVYSPLDTFKYSAPGVHEYGSGTSYFSLNGDQLLLPFNDPSNGGDPGDWGPSVHGDSFDAFGDTGTVEQLSSVDLRLMELLGYHLSYKAPTPNGVPTSPLVFNQTLQTAAGQTMNFDGPFALVMKKSGSVAPSLTNAATVIDTGFKSQTDVVGLTTGYVAGGALAQGEDSGFSNSTFTNTATGTLNVTATAVAADAVGVYWGPAVVNSGLIQVTSDTADAWGVEGDSFTNTASGILKVQAVDYATGIDMLLSDGGAFSNAGTIEVTGKHAIGVEGMTSFSNSGTLKAIGVGSGSTSTAIYVTAPYGTNFTNSGLIEASQAFAVDPTYVGGPTPSITITNSGTIHGTIDFINSNNTIHNTGTIVGAIHYGDGNSLYDGASGKQSGGIYLGYGTNSVTLGNDGEAVFGGGGSDTITGGSGNDFIEIARGTSSIDGGGGFNTLSLADSDIGVSVNLANGTISGAGTSTIANIQQVVGSTFNDTLTAGSTAATLIGGGGHDTLVGGASGDTLVAGGGGDTMTGNGGNDTFVYSSGDHQVVVTDFGANANSDVLKIYGYASALSTQQQGADTLITLSATDTVLLKNVQASSLTAANLVFNSTPFAGPTLPASPPIFGTTTIKFTYDLTIQAGETLNELEQNVGFVDVGGGSPNWNNQFHSLTNFGTVKVTTSSGDVTGVTADISASFGGLIANKAGATFSVTDSDPNGVAKGLDTGFGPPFLNDGTFTVSAVGDAYGIDTSFGGENTKNSSTGVFTVTSSAGTAYGILAQNGAEAAQGGIVNAGSLKVSGAVAAYGIRSAGWSNTDSVNNSGTILVTGLNGTTKTYGIYVSGRNQHTGTITNSGTITAQVAIKSGAELGSASTDLVITNSGHINGAVELDDANDTIHNTGSIVGAIHYGDGNSLYDGASGKQSGGIYLGYGTNSVTLGNDGEAVFGGGGSDTITGGSGNDFFEIGRGTNSIDGGGGFNTLSLADSDIGVSVNLASGAVSGAGTSTIANIQQVVGSTFNDTLTAGSTAATLIGGGGHDVLVGGASGDTLVAGGGGDTMTGNGGNDTFVYSSGDHQVVVTDFGANANSDVLKIYGYTSALSTQQQGADTLITLSATDTVLLKNVQASALTSANLVFNATPFAGPTLPASPPIYFGSTAPIYLPHDFTLFAGETINIVAHISDLNINQNMGFFDVTSDFAGAQGLHNGAIDNSGTIRITSGDDNLWGVFATPGFFGGDMTNRAGALFSVTDTVGAATGMTLDPENQTVTNAGKWQVQAVTTATGLLSGGPVFVFSNQAGGEFDVTSSTGNAIGLDLGSGGAAVTNDGTIAVSAAGAAYGIQSLAGQFSSGFYEGNITNNGTITATSSSALAATYGIAVSSPYNTSIASIIVNTGTITAETAILNTDSGQGFTPLNVSNSGTLNGDVDLGGSDSKLTNTGHINGNVFFDTVQNPVNTQFSFGFGPPGVANSGIINGDIVLGGGTLTITNTGTIHGNIVLAGGNNDFIDLTGGTLTGAIVIHGSSLGVNAKITGGASNTTVQYDIASTQASITRASDGSWNVAAGTAGGYENLTHVQTLVFTDKTITLPMSGPSTANFNDDGTSDILWQNANGQAAIWTIDGLTQVGGAQVGGNPGSSWHVKAAADFNGDHIADILWQNDSGQAAIWTMQGLTQIGGATVGGNPGPSWHVVAAADFNGDGKADILWQNDNGQAAIWTMDGLNQIGGATVGGNPGPSWHIKAAADFNGDGKADILWQNDNGQVAIWLMNGLTQIGGATVGGNPGPTWHVIGAGDFNGDGKADILWQNDSGQAAIWTMNGLNQIGGATVGGNPGPTWHVKGAGDYNGDGYADILWQNDSGQAAIWTMNGFTQLGGAQVGGTPGTAWHVVGQAG